MTLAKGATKKTPVIFQFRTNRSPAPRQRKQLKQLSDARLIGDSSQKRDLNDRNPSYEPQESSQKRAVASRVGRPA